MEILERIFSVIFQDNAVRSREELSEIFETNDRAVRRLIREARRRGVPIIPVSTGGYKLAQTNEEKQKLLKLYRGRAMDELVTYSALRKILQIDGQLTADELVAEACGGIADAR